MMLMARYEGNFNVDRWCDKILGTFVAYNPFGHPKGATSTTS